MNIVVKNLTLFLFAIYGIGFLVMNFFLIDLGIADKEIFSVDYLKAGMVFLLFISPILFIIWVFRSKKTNIVIKKDWILSILIISISNFVLIGLYFGVYKEKPIISLPLLILFFLVWIINRFLSNYRLISLIMFYLILLIITFVELYISHKLKIIELTSFWIIICCTAYTIVLEASWDIQVKNIDAVEKAFDRVGLLLATVFMACLFGYTLYKKMPYTFGGGEITKKILLPTKEYYSDFCSKYNLDSNHWSKCQNIVYENHNKIYIIINDSTIIGLNKKYFNEIIEHK